MQTSASLPMFMAPSSSPRRSSGRPAPAPPPQLPPALQRPRCLTLLPFQFPLLSISHADKRIIADVYGTELVAEAIKRQARSRAERSLSQHERSLVTGRDSSKNSSQSGTGDDFAFGDAASGAGAGTMHGPHGSQSTPLMTIGGSPTGQHVLYKQWHPAVSVLFAGAYVCVFLGGKGDRDGKVVVVVRSGCVAIAGDGLGGGGQC